MRRRQCCGIASRKSLGRQALREPGLTETEFRGTWSPRHQEIANLATHSPSFDEPGEAASRQVLRKVASRSGLLRFEGKNDSPSRTSIFGFICSFSAGIFRMARHEA